MDNTGWWEIAVWWTRLAAFGARARDADGYESCYVMCVPAAQCTLTVTVGLEFI